MLQRQKLVEWVTEQMRDAPYKVGVFCAVCGAWLFVTMGIFRTDLPTQIRFWDNSFGFAIVATAFLRALRATRRSSWKFYVYTLVGLFPTPFFILGFAVEWAFWVSRLMDGFIYTK